MLTTNRLGAMNAMCILFFFCNANAEKKPTARRGYGRSNSGVSGVILSDKELERRKIGEFVLQGMLRVVE